MNDKELAELKRIKAILSAVTGLEDDDQEYIEDARKALQFIISQDAIDKMAENARALVSDDEIAAFARKFKNLEREGWITEAEAVQEIRAMYGMPKLLNNPEDHYPGNFDTPQRANALLTGLCQDAANEIAKLQAEVLEQCRINGMSAEREDSLRAELTQLKANIALDKMAGNASELGLDYEPAVQEGRDWSLLEATQESLREHMAEIKRLKAAQPAPVQDLPFGVGGGLVAIKTLLSRDPCIHSSTAIMMIEAILKEHPEAQPGVKEG
jgi:hypothetical protein